MCGIVGRWRFSDTLTEFWQATKVFDWHHDSNSFVLLVNLSEIPEAGKIPYSSRILL